MRSRRDKKRSECQGKDSREPRGPRGKRQYYDAKKKRWVQKVRLPGGQFRCLIRRSTPHLEGAALPPSALAGIDPFDADSSSLADSGVFLIATRIPTRGDVRSICQGGFGAAGCAGSSSFFEQSASPGVPKVSVSQGARSSRPHGADLVWGGRGPVIGGRSRPAPRSVSRCFVAAEKVSLIFFFESSSGK